MLAKSHKSDIVNQVVLHWTFNDYVQSGQNPIEKWYEDDLTDVGRFAFDALLKNTAKTESHMQWGGFQLMKGEAKKQKVWELKFFADDKQYRVFGIFDGAKTVILLVGCYHKGKIYSPANAIETAVNRAKALRDGKASYIGRKIKTDI
jgi:hypothetical protein